MSNNNITITISNQPLMDKITQLQQEIITLEETVISLNAQIADLNQQVEQKQATIDSLNTQISQLQEQISQLDAQVSALTEQVQTLILENSQLTEQVQSLTSQVSQLTEQVQQLQASVESLNGQITSMTNQINTINGETVQNPIEYLSGTKSQILQALQSKGSSATASTTFREYVSEVSQLNPKGDLHTKLLLRFSETNTYGDVSVFNTPITYSSGFTRSGTVKKFGDYSFQASSSSYLSINRFEVPIWRYTIEFWVYLTSMFTSNYYCLAGVTNSVVSTSMFYIYFFGFYNNTTTLRYRINNSYEHSFDKSLFTLNEWHHIAYTRNNNHWYTFLDGVRLESNNSSNLSPAVWTGLNFEIGNSRMQNVTAYIDEFRISDICRYTEDFEPPTEPFTI